MAVTPDKYELPLIVSPVREEVAEYAGVKLTTVSTAIYQNTSGKNRGVKFAKVEVKEVMKHGKKPTFKQRVFMKQNRLRPETWLVERDTVIEMIVVSRSGKSKRTLKKG